MRLSLLEVVGDFGSSCAAFDIEKLIVMTINTHTQKHTPHTRTHMHTYRLKSALWLAKRVSQKSRLLRDKGKVCRENPWARI